MSLKKYAFFILGAFLSLFMTVSSVFAHDNVRVGTVNIFVIEQESTAWQKKIAELEEILERNRSEIIDFEVKLQAEIKEYDSQRPLLSQDQQQERDAEINQKLAELQNRAGQMNAELDKQSSLSSQSLRVKIAEYIQSIAEERKLDLILEVGAENFAVTFFSGRLDITSEVIEILNKNYTSIQL